MPLACLTPTRRRWTQLVEQAHALAPQLAEDDLWIIGSDNEYFSHAKLGQIEAIIPRRHLAWLKFEYWHAGTVNRLRNSLAAFATPTHDLVEVDDHDLLAPYALAEIRHAFEAGYDYVFGWHALSAPIEQEDGRVQYEPWPTVERDYTPGAFARHEYDAIGLRAIRRSLWNKLGGWGQVFPGGHYDFARRAEEAGAKIVCLQQPLCTVTIAPTDSISALCHELYAAGESSSAKSSSGISTVNEAST